MFQRIKNLLELSKYTVEELKQQKFVLSSSGEIEYTYTPATIINATEEDPFKDFEDETIEQPSDDTASRDKNIRGS